MESIQNCLFCEIIRREVEAHRIWEDTDTLVFLDNRPLFPGHCLVVPKQHHAELFDLPEPLVSPLFSRVREVSQVVKLAMECQGTFVALNNKVSQSIPHLHVHIVPRTKGDGLKGFFWPRNLYTDDQHILRVAKSLREAASDFLSSSGG